MNSVGANWGSYTKRPLRLRDLVPPDGRQFILENDFVYTDANGVSWVAPAEYVSDGASIPTIFWSVIGGPWDGLYREAAVIHDAACCGQTVEWKLAHRMFYAALRCSGVKWVQAKLMFYAVWFGGPRWKEPRPTMPKCCLAGYAPCSPSRLAMQWPGELQPQVVDELWEKIQNRPLNPAEARSVALPFVNRVSMSDQSAREFVEGLRQAGPTLEEKELITLSVIRSQRIDEDDVRKTEDWLRREDPDLPEIEARAEEKRNPVLSRADIFPDVYTLPSRLI